MKLLSQLTNGKAAANETAKSFEGLILVDEETRKVVQNEILNIFLDVQAACKKHDIEIMLGGGSALGAVRHQGFIPWDDDLDAMMRRKDYEKLKVVFEKELGEHYILNAPNYSNKVNARFPKILKKGTVFREIGTPDDPEMCGLFLDIFVIDNIPNNPVLKFSKGLLCNFLEFIASKVQFVESADALQKEFNLKIGRANYWAQRIIGSVFSVIPSQRWLSWIDTVIQYKDENSAFCGPVTGRKHYFGEALPRPVFSPVSKGVFCGHEVALPGKVELYLQNLYGDSYMQLPPVEKREMHFVREINLSRND